MTTSRRWLKWNFHGARRKARRNDPKGVSRRSMEEQMAFAVVVEAPAQSLTKYSRPSPGMKLYRYLGIASANEARLRLPSSSISPNA
jgi:hypothetical protein